MSCKEALMRLGLPEDPVGQQLEICVKLSREVPELCLKAVITRKEISGGFMELTVDGRAGNVKINRLIRPIDQGLDEIMKGWLVCLVRNGSHETARMARVKTA